MKIRILRILAFIIGYILIPFSAITWFINGKESISMRLFKFSLLNDEQDSN